MADKQVSVNIEGRYRVSTEGIDEARQKAEALAATQGDIADSAGDAGEAMTQAMQRASQSMDELGRKMQGFQGGGLEPERPSDLLRQGMQAVNEADYDRAQQLRTDAARRAMQTEDTHSFQNAQRLTKVIHAAQGQDAGQESKARFERLYGDLDGRLHPAREGNTAGESGGLLKPDTAMGRASGILARAGADMSSGLDTRSEVKRMDRDLSKVDYYLQEAKRGGGDPQKIEKLNEHLEELTEALEGNREAVNNSARGGAVQPRTPDGGGGGGLGGLGDDLLGEVKRMAGQGMGRMGMLGRLAGRLGVPALVGGAAIGAFNYVGNKLEDANQEGRQAILGMTDLSRQYGVTDNPMRMFRDEEGFTVPEIARFNYTATNAGAVAAQYNLPGGNFREDIASILAFSRTTGLEESQIAEMTRELGVAGTFERGDAQSSLQFLKSAVTEGIKDGVAGSDTIRNLVGIVEEGFERGNEMSASALAYQASLQQVLASTGNRVMQGESGAQVQQGINAALTGGDDFGMQLALINGIQDRFTARNLGYIDPETGQLSEEGEAYQALYRQNPVQAITQFGLDRVRGGLGSDQLRVLLAERLDQLFGGNRALQALYYKENNITGAPNLLMQGEGFENTIEGAVPGQQPGEDLSTYQPRYQMDNLVTDPQGGFGVAFETRMLQARDDEAKLLGSIANVGLTGDVEGLIRNVKTSASFLASDAKQFFSGSPVMTAEGGDGGFRADYGTAPSYDMPSINKQENEQNEAMQDALNEGAISEEDRGPTYVPEGLENSGLEVAPAAIRALPSDMSTVDKYNTTMLRAAMMGGVEANVPDDANDRTGAFGWTQIMPENLTGDAGWDQAFINSEKGRLYQQMFMREGLSIDDPVPDAVARAAAGDDTDAIPRWYNDLEPKQQDLISQFLNDASLHKLGTYVTEARENGVTDPREVAMRAGGAWYAGPNERDLAGGISILDPAYKLDASNPDFIQRWGDDDNHDGIRDEPSIQQYIQNILDAAEFSFERKETSAGEPQRVIVEFRGTDFTVTGLQGARAEGFTAGIKQAAMAVAAPQSYRGS